MCVEFSLGISWSQKHPSVCSLWHEGHPNLVFTDHVCSRMEGHSFMNHHWNCTPHGEGNPSLYINLACRQQFQQQIPIDIGPMSSTLCAVNGRFVFRSQNSQLLEWP